ncbi:MAG: Gfo/Idh/MocA family oxidoreductase [archaeon]
MKAAVIGIGAMGANHARVYAEKGILAAVSDQDEALLEKARKRYTARTYKSYRELIDTEKPDIVSVAVPTKMHEEVATYALKNGVHTLLEKPIASTHDEAAGIIKAAKNAKLMIGHIERFNPAVIELKRQFDAGVLGRIFKIDVNRVGPFPSRIRDVGVVIDLAVHDLNVISYLVNSRAKRVYAETEKRIHTLHEDLLSGVLKYESGEICNLNINWLTPTKIRKIYVTGEKGMFVANYLSQDLYFYENDESKGHQDYADLMRGVSEGRMIKMKVDKKEPLLLEIEHFIDCVENNRPVLVTGEDGAAALYLAEKLVESSRQGKVIEL